MADTVLHSVQLTERDTFVTIVVIFGLRIRIFESIKTTVNKCSQLFDVQFKRLLNYFN